MNLIKIDNAQLYYGEQVIFEQVSLQVSKGDRLCIVGRNGVGKSTLLKVIEGAIELDAGSVWREAGTRIAVLQQDLPERNTTTVFDFVAGGLPDLGQDLSLFEKLSQDPQADLELLGRVQQRIEALDGWAIRNQVEQVLSRLQLDAASALNQLSGGWRRRAALARALVCQPEVLLLDEPTNHLDIAAIEWLEQQLRQYSGAVVFITHDRHFLQQVATSIAELDRGGLYLWRGDYAGFTQYREQRLADEQKRDSEFDKRLAQEEVWIRQGIKARRTRNEGRVRALEQMRRAFAERRSQAGTANMAITEAQASGKIVAQFESVSFHWGEQAVVSDFTGTILRGDKIGLIGPNGIGKSTFLKLLTGELQAQSGRVVHGTKLAVSYFDQLREQLNLDLSAADNVSEGRDFIELGDSKKHIIGYLNDFLFSGERARTPIRALSGGERNRVLLAKLFSLTSNCLILDEPTNDLDVETLELLEELLSSYQGTLLLVSHDRQFLDNVVSSTIAFEGHGRVKQYVGGYDDWKRQGGVWFDPQAAAIGSASPEPHSAVQAQSGDYAPKKAAKKLSYKLQRELEQLPAQIEALEMRLAQLQAQSCAPDFYNEGAEAIAKVTTELAQVDSDLQAAYERWQELESLQEGGA